MKERRRTVRQMPGDHSRSASMLEGWRGYIYRDPARCSPDRLAELAAHDDYIAALEEFWGNRASLERMRRHGLLRKAG